MVHQHSVLDRDTPFYIDPTTRSVYNNEGSKILIQGDHNSERFTFSMPRYIESHDMSLCNRVEIHYTNFKTKKKTNSDVYLPDDINCTDDSITFSWLISSGVTMYDGNVSFVIKMLCLDGDTITYCFQTMLYSDITVAPSIQNTEALFDTQSDLINGVKRLVLDELDDIIPIIDEDELDAALEEVLAND